MKNFGSTVEFTRERNADLMRAFRERLASADRISMDTICEEVSESRSRRFWVSEERAAIVISEMERRGRLPVMTEKKREMYMEIYCRYVDLRAREPGKTMLELAGIIVNQEAPKFYMTPKTARELIRRVRNGYYEDKG